MRWTNTDGVRLGGICENFETVEISSAQLLDLVANPVALLPAPGPGKMIVAWVWQAVLNYVSSPYVIPSNQFGVVYGGPNSVSAAFNPPVDVTVAASQAGFRISGSGVSDALDEFENVPLLLVIDQDLTGGDSPITSSMAYTVCPV